MPQGYKTRAAEIQRLLVELQGMDRFGRLLWESGPELRESVRDALVALKLEAEPSPDPASLDLTVKLDARRRLLIHVSDSSGTIAKKDLALARIVQMVQGADEGDRVVLVANHDPEKRPTERSECLKADALEFLRRMGANLVTGPTLFKVWSVSVQDHDRARKHLDRLHAQDGGEFQIPSPGS
jgi:hypothetical protein